MKIVLDCRACEEYFKSLISILRHSTHDWLERGDALLDTWNGHTKEEHGVTADVIGEAFTRALGWEK